jgi:hypothetical protein
MSRQSRDPWRLPVLDRIGAQLRELESTEVTRRRRRRISISGGLVAAVLATFALLDMGQLADALSPINRAPAAAAASESVKFDSTITIVLNGHQQERFTEHGEIDFARRNYRTTLQLGHGEAIEQRRVDGVLYVAQLPGGRSQHAPIRWRAVPLAHEAATTFASAPESEEFTSPLVLLDELGGTRATVKVVGTEDLHGVLPTTLYRLQISLASLLSASPGAGSQPASYRGVGATLTVWLDRHGRPRRVDETVAGASSVGGASITTVTEFTGYGQPVAVRAPTKLLVRAKRSIVAPTPLAASPSRFFERLLFAHP